MKTLKAVDVHFLANSKRIGDARQKIDKRIRNAAKRGRTHLVVRIETLPRQVAQGLTQDGFQVDEMRHCDPQVLTIGWGNWGGMSLDEMLAE